MTAMNATNTSFQGEVISDKIKIITFCEIGLSIVTMIANVLNFFVIRNKFKKATLVYQVQKLDSLVTAVCQIGIIIILFESISDAPNTCMCTLGTALLGISNCHFLLSNVFMVTGK